MIDTTLERPQQAPVATLGSTDVSAFVRRTYTHLFAAIAGFTVFEIFLFQTGLAFPIARALLSVPWLLVLGGFVIVGWFASRVAHRAESRSAQYLALTSFVVAEALLFVPMLFVAQSVASRVIESAVVVTLLAFAGLTAIALMTSKDFTFFGGILRWGFVVALVLIVASLLFGFELGVIFSVVMIGLAGVAILHDTSKVLLYYPEDRYVAASLELFASVALMFWYVLRLFTSLSRN